MDPFLYPQRVYVGRVKPQSKVSEYVDAYVEGWVCNYCSDVKDIKEHAY